MFNGSTVGQQHACNKLKQDHQLWHRYFSKSPTTNYVTQLMVEP